MLARVWAATRAFDPALPIDDSISAPVESPLLQSQWSRQDVLTLAGVCVAIVAVLVALVSIMFPPLKLRKWLCRPFHWVTRRLRPNTECLPLSSPSPYPPMIIENWQNTDPRAVRQQWQERYNESLRVRCGGF